MLPAIESAVDRVRGAWRFRWLGLLIATAVCVVAWGIVFLVPDSYRASSRVFIDTNTPLSQVTRGIGGESDVESQIVKVRQALLGGPQLEKVAADSGLLTGVVDPRSRDLVIADLRKRIEITSTASVGASVYVISFKDRSRDTALRVVDRLLKTFVQGTLTGKREGSAQAQNFLVSQIAELEHRLSASEERLADFKKRNVGLMPGAQGDYFTRLQAEMEALGKAQSAVGLATRRRDELRRQLRGEEPVTPRGTSLGSATGGALTGAGTDTGSRIRETQARLDDLLLRFTDKHPDVIAMRATLEELKLRQQTELDAVKRGDPGAIDRSGLAANPVYQSLQLQSNQAEVDLAAAEADVADRQHKIASLRSVVNTAPEVEAEYARLNRDYDVTKAQYQALLERLERTKLGENAQETGIVRFEVIDPPNAPYDPVAPNRPLLIALLLAFGIGAGGMAAYLTSVMRPVFSNVRQLAEVTQLPVLGAVSMTWLEAHRARLRIDALRYTGAVLALFLVAAVIVVLQSRIAHLVRGIA